MRKSKKSQAEESVEKDYSEWYAKYNIVDVNSFELKQWHRILIGDLDDCIQEYEKKYGEIGKIYRKKHQVAIIGKNDLGQEL